MRRLVLIPICFLALAVPVVVLASGAQGGFDGVVSTIELRYHVHALRIPFLGLISFISRQTTAGVSGVHVAEFEDFHGDVNGDELNKLVVEKLGAGWERMIRETSKGGSQTLIFTHPEGKKMGMFVIDLDGHDLSVVQVTVDPDHLSQSLGRYEHHHPRDPDQDGEMSN